MFLLRFLVLFVGILNIKYVKSMAEDVVQLREHFIASLLEENREKLHQNITNEIQEAINQKIEAFLKVIDEPKERIRRETNDLLLHEKSTDIDVLKGFEGRGVVPINFPKDICMFRINGKSIAVGLSEFKAQENILTIFKRVNNKVFQKVREFKSKHLTKIDCRSTGSVGYVAVVNSGNGDNNLTEIPSSFIYRLTFDEQEELKIETMQIFPEPNQISVKMWNRDRDLFLIYTYSSDVNAPRDKCAIYKLENDNFVVIDYLPCQNSRIVEFFSIGQELFVFLGNRPESNSTTNAFSTIMRYDPSKQKFRVHEKLYTNAIAVGKYFYLDYNRQRQHFLFIGNSYELNEFGMINFDVPSVIYKLVNGFFVPLQTIKVSHVKDVAPIVGNSDFHLLVASEATEVQIYFFDGWKFQESNLDFTGDAFSGGVTSMRVYDDIIEKTTTLVISNPHMNAEEFNVYTPVYVKKKDSAKIKTSILKWCNEAFERVDDFDVHKSDEKLKSAFNLTSNESEEVHLMNEVKLKNITVGTIHTNQFIYRGTVVDGKNINKLNDIKRRNDLMRKDIATLRQKIEFSEATKRVRRQTESKAIVDKLTIEGPFSVETVNGKPITNLVYTKNSKNQRMKSVTARKVLIKQELFVDGKIDGIEMAEDNLIMNGPRQILRPMKVNKLTVKNINPVNVNGMSFNDFFTLLKRKMDPKIPNLIHELDVEKMDIVNLLNGKNFTTLAIDSMKSNGPQVLKAPFIVKKMQVNSLNFQKTAESISKTSVRDLIDIKDVNPIQIFQDIRFVEPLEVKQLFVNDRINNLNVKDRKLQVLRTSGVEEQTVTGEKTFKAVNLREPIVLRGKIESKSLERMNPVITIDKNLVLQGDFVIKGPVTVERLLNVTGDVTSRNSQLGLRKLGESGIHLALSTSTKNKIIFKDFLQVRGNLRTSSINSIPTDSFVKLDVNQEQVIKGRKIFKKNLLVKGKVDADVVNDVDLKRLDETVLKKVSKGTQFIDGNVMLASLQVNQITAKSAKINEKDIDLVLSRKRPQKLNQLKLENIKVRNLNAKIVEHKIGAKVLGNDVNFLIDDSLTKDSFVDTVVAEKKFANLKVESLKFAEGNEWKNIIANFENILKGSNLNSDVVVNEELEIRNLIVKGKINEVAYEDMISKWLRLEGDQVFKAPQRFRKLNVIKNLNVEEINGMNVNQMIENSIYVDKPISLDSLHIKGLLAVAKKIQTPLINGDTFNEKMVFNNTQEYQELKKVIVSGDGYVQHLNFTSLNGINCKEFLNIFNGNDETSVSLKVVGKAGFTHPVNITFLNYANVQELYDTVWLANRDVDLKGDNILFLGDVKLEGVLYAESLNSRNLDELFTHYFSKSREQTIGGNLNVIGNIHAMKNFMASKTIVPNYVKIDEHTHLDIKNFAHKILRNNANQEVTGKWHIRKLVLYGDFNGLINGLDLQNDVLHAGNPEAVMHGMKSIHILDVHDVSVNLINGINVDDWMRNAVRVNSSADQFIDGHVTFKKYSRFDHSLNVYGTINNIPITPQTVLMKNRENQVINGDVTFFIIDVRSRPMNGHPNQVFIEHLKLNGDINGRNYAELSENLFRSDSDFIDSKVVFEKELRVNELQTNKSIYGTDMVEFLKGSEVSNHMLKFKKNMEHLAEVGEDLVRSLSDSVTELSHFEFVQTLSGKDIQKSALFSNRHAGVNNYFLAVHEKNSTMEFVNFYKWNRESKKFILEPLMLPLAYPIEGYKVIHLYKVTYRGVDHLYLEYFDIRRNEYSQNLLVFDSQIGTFRHVIKSIGVNSAKLFTWMDGSMACFGFIYTSDDKVIITCEGMPQTVIQIGEPVKEVSSLSDALIVLTESGRVRVWHDQLFLTIPGIMNPQSFSAIRYNDKYYLAVRTDVLENTIHNGEIHIFESPVSEINFKEIQKLSLIVPTSIKFSKAPSGDLLLYVTSRNEPRAFFVFSYAGSSNFVSSIGEDTIIKKASDLDYIQLDGNTEMVSVASKENVHIIKAVLNEF